MTHAIANRRISVLALDVDGVLTDGRVVLDEHSRENKVLCYRDIDAVFQARREGLAVAIVTGESSPMVDVIGRRLEVETVIADAKDKVAALAEVCDRLRIGFEQICYIGDADRDAPALSRVALGLAPVDGSAQAQQSAHRVLNSPGGSGAVAEALLLVRRLNQDDKQAKNTVSVPHDQPGHAAHDVKQSVLNSLQQSIALKQKVVEMHADTMAVAATWVAETLAAGGKLLVFGAGRSGAAASLIAAEFVARLGGEGRGWPAIVLHANTSNFSVPDNSDSHQQILARQLQTLGRAGDLALALTTNPESEILLQSLIVAREGGLRVIGLAGMQGGSFASLCDLALCAPSSQPAGIHECHLAVCHAVSEAVEQILGSTQATDE